MYKGSNEQPDDEYKHFVTNIIGTGLPSIDMTGGQPGHYIVGYVSVDENISIQMCD